MSNDSSQDSKEHREYYRIAVEIPVSVSRATDEEQANPLAQIIFDTEMMELAHLPSNADSMDPKEWMKMVNNKLNEIISLINGDSDQGSQETTFVQISAGGMDFFNDQSFEAEEVLKFKLALESEVENHHLKIFGKVLASKRDDQFDSIKTSVVFIGLDDDIRNIISNFIINKERETLRDRMDQGNY